MYERMRALLSSNVWMNAGSMLFAMEEVIQKEGQAGGDDTKSKTQPRLGHQRKPSTDR